MHYQIQTQRTTNGKPSDGAASVEILTDYLGEYTAPGFPLKVTAVEANGVLELHLEGEQPLPLESEGNGEFSMGEAGIKVQFNPEKTGFKLDLGGQVFEFTKKLRVYKTIYYKNETV